MAYQGRKVFQAGEVLASSDMNSTVDQTVMVFADATARNTAIQTPTEGMLVYLKDTNEVLKYDGTNWVAIQEVADDLITTEGDLIIGGADGAAERLPIGGNETVLTSDGTNISWAAPDTGVASNNFVVDINDTANNFADIGETRPAGPYVMNFSSGDNTFDVYLLDNNGDSVGYSNTTSITASADFVGVVILGVSDSEIISFTFQGVVTNPTGEGNQTGAGAYLVSATPTDLPFVDDTTTVTGGNFASDVAITFESGATVLSAKNIVVNNSTELLITRPDNLEADLDPWTLRAVNPTIDQPSGSNANLLQDEITAGASPTWVTASLPNAQKDIAYSETLEATDADGSVTYSITVGTLPTGLSLNSSTGVISGTPTGSTQTFTATVTDEGDNTNDREFTIGVLQATGGTITLDGANVVHTFEDDGTFEATSEIIAADYLILAGGGGGGPVGNSADRQAGGGGAGGFLEGNGTIAVGTYAVTVGNGGPANTGFGNGISGNDSQLGSLGTAIGGGAGGGNFNDGGNGGSGGGGASQGGNNGGTGVDGQGFDGGGTNSGSDVNSSGAGGGGAGGVGQSTDNSGVPGGDGGPGKTWVDGVLYAAGGPGEGVFGDGTHPAPNALGSGGAGGNAGDRNGQKGIVIIRY